MVEAHSLKLGSRCTLTGGFVLGKKYFQKQPYKAAQPSKLSIALSGNVSDCFITIAHVVDLIRIFLGKLIMIEICAHNLYIELV